SAASLGTDDGYEFFDYFSGIAYNPVSPTFGGLFTVTTKDGLAYEINGRTGQLNRVGDRNGNTLTFANDGGTSSAGPHIAFERDPQGRITAVVDPSGKKILYGHSAAGDLVSVTDRDNNPPTQFFYEQPGRAHFLTKVIDPLGHNGVRTEYDDQGRLVSMI